MQDIRTLVVFFGPPGVGKSTVVAKLGGFDLEMLPNTEWRKALIPAFTSGVFGAADTQPSDWPRGAIKVLLLPDRPTYDERRAARDRRQPHKAGQPDVYDGFAQHAADFDLVLKNWTIR